MVEQGFMLTSPAFTSDGSIPTEMTCDGENRPPVLKWIHAPRESRSFALIIEAALDRDPLDLLFTLDRFSGHDMWPACGARWEGKNSRYATSISFTSCRRPITAIAAACASCF